MNFICDSCGGVHDFKVDFNFGLPKEFVLQLHNDQLNYEKSERWLVVENNYFLIKCIIEIPIHSYDDNFFWQMWVMIEKADFLDFINLLKTGKCNSELFGSGTIFANIPYFDNTYGEKVMYKLSNLEFFPELKIIDQETRLAKVSRKGVSKEEAIEIFKKIIHAPV